MVLWESLSGRRLFRGDNEGMTLQRVLEGDIPPPSELRPPEAYTYRIARVDAPVTIAVTVEYTYQLYDAAGAEVAVVQERSMAVAIIRRLVGFIPYVDNIADWLPISMAPRCGIWRWGSACRTW